MSIFEVIQIIVGFVGLIALAVPFSDNFKIINYRYIVFGILAQIILAIILLKIPFIINFFEILGLSLIHI